MSGGSTPSRQRLRILVVDDHAEMASMLADQLIDEGYLVDIASSGEAAIGRMSTVVPDAVVTDLKMGDVDGFDVLEAVKNIDPTLPVLIMTAFGAIESAIEAMRRGAYHYLTKPFRLDEVCLQLERALAERRLRVDNAALRRLAEERSSLHKMLGASRCMRDLYELIQSAAQVDAPVLVRGESGTGKELVAQALHFSSQRRDRPFVALNCTALPEALLESELFGHVKGAFTGATHARRGLFVEADGGTLLLDEIGDMPSLLQAKLLRVLQSGEVRPVGADQSRSVDVRILAATHQPLERHIAEGRFRSDLFYRLDVVTIGVPPLRERLEDLPTLAESFLSRQLHRNPSAPLRTLDPSVFDTFSRYHWPGNVRELENVIARLAALCRAASADADDLRRLVPAFAAQPSTPQWPQPLGDPGELLPLRVVTDRYIDWVVDRCEGNKTRAAEILGVDVSTLHRRARARRDDVS